MEVLIAAEVVVGACLALAIGLLVVLFVRRRLLAGGGDLLYCALRPDDRAPWRTGLLRFDDTSLAWFPLLGLTLRPSYCWPREGLDIGAYTALPPGTGMDASTVVTTLTNPDAQRAPDVTQVAIGREPYTALRSWMEATPPGHRPVDW